MVRHRRRRDRYLLLVNPKQDSQAGTQGQQIRIKSSRQRQAQGGHSTRCRYAARQAQGRRTPCRATFLEFKIASGTGSLPKAKKQKARQAVSGKNREKIKDAIQTLQKRASTFFTNSIELRKNWIKLQREINQAALKYREDYGELSPGSRAPQSV